MDTKSRGVAAVLNFFLPGLGFAYIGRPSLVVGGVIFFLASLLDAFNDLAAAVTTERLILGLAGGAALAIMAGEITEIHNRIGPAYRACPFCAEEVKSEAKVCKHCGRDLPSHP